MDVIVIGGGPAGLQAARCLASDGFEVEVLEEHLSTGEPVHCTGILSPEVFEKFELDPNHTLNELRLIQFHSPKGRVIHYQTEKVEAVVIDRTAFDRNLENLARTNGARVCPGVKAERIEITENGVAVYCSDSGRRKAQACILATGAAYGLHRDLGIGLPPVYLNCAQAELRTHRPGDVEIHLGEDIAPKGFGWIVPVERAEGAFARIGLMCEGNAAACFKKLLLRLDKWKIKANSEEQCRQRILPLAPIRKTYGNRFLVVGDAAGFVKPTTGGGIFYGMISAGIAAGVLGGALKAGRFSESELSLYQKLWQERLMEEIEAQLTLRLLMQRLTDDELETIFDLWATDGLMPLIRKTASLNHHRKLIMAITKYPAMRKILFRRVIA
jgi:digeranylgeranylglycerophospholipid reductase